MIDISGIEYDFMPSVLWTIGIVVAGAVMFGFGLTLISERWSGWLGIPGLILLIVGLIPGPVYIIGVQAASAVTAEETALASEQLSDQGFSRVVLDWEGKSFTASVDGQYFEGVLHPVGGYKYQVLAVEEVKP